SPCAVLGMGGFTSMPPLWAGKRAGKMTFLHEANVIPGRANRWASKFAEVAFVNFPETAQRIRARNCEVVGMPVRAQFEPMDPASCRVALGLRPDRPVILVMGGSQGASAINQLIMNGLALFAQRCPEIQFLHLTGSADLDAVKAGYQSAARQAVVRPFLSEM